MYKCFLVGISSYIWLGSRGLYFGPKTIFIPPPFWKWYFFPLSRHVVFRLPSWPFCLNSSLFCIHFTLFLPFSHFLSPFFIFLSPFFLFLLHFPPFSLPLFIFFPPNDIGWYLFPPPPGGGRIFQYIDPCSVGIYNLSSKHNPQY